MLRYLSKKFSKIRTNLQVDSTTLKKFIIISPQLKTIRSNYFITQGILIRCMVNYQLYWKS